MGERRSGMRKTLAFLNDLEQRGLFRRYAIGGAVATLFYPIEPAETEDLDILILLPPEQTASLDPLAALHAEIIRQGYQWKGPYLSIEGMPVQFLVAYNPLVEDAVESAVDMQYEGVMTRVPTAEHLTAIMLDTGRAKDRGRFEQMLQDVPLDRDRLTSLLQSHGLSEKFRQWTRK
jgi:hypothetical protein